MTFDIRVVKNDCKEARVFARWRLPLLGRCSTPSLYLNHELLQQGTADHLILLRQLLLFLFRFLLYLFLPRLLLLLVFVNSLKVISGLLFLRHFKRISVAWYATLHPTLSVHALVRPYGTLYFFSIF